MRPIAVAVVAALAASPTPAAAEGGWRVRTLDAPAGSRLLGLAADGRGRLSAMLDVRGADGHRLVIRASGRSRTLMKARDGFEGAMAADRRGRPTGVWIRYRRSAATGQAFAWSGGRVQRLTDGPRDAAFVRLAVASDGAAITAVTRGEQMLVARRGGPHGRFGQAQVLPDLAGAPHVTASGGFAVAGRAPGAERGEVVAAVAARLADPFGAAVRFASPASPPGTASFLRSAVAGFAPDGALVVAYSALHERGEPPAEPRVVASSVYASVWPRDAAGPQPPIELSRRRRAYDPALVVTGRRSWLTWSEGDGECCRAGVIAAAPLVRGGVGAVVRGRAGPATAVGFERPTAVAEAGDGVRYYVPSTNRRRTSLYTVRLSPTGAFGTPERIAAGPVLAPPDRHVQVVPARGPLAGGAVGWTTSDGDRGAIRIARRLSG